jgi:hypothetical protein
VNYGINNTHIKYNGAIRCNAAIYAAFYIIWWKPSFKKQFKNRKSLIHVYRYDGTSYAKVAEFPIAVALSDMSLSPDGVTLAVAGLAVGVGTAQAIIYESEAFSENYIRPATIRTVHTVPNLYGLVWIGF